MRWDEALLATNHNMERGAAYSDASGVPAKVFDRAVSYSSRWRYTSGANGLDALIRSGQPVGTAEMKSLLQRVAQGTTEHSIILRPDASPMVFELANATGSALDGNGLWDAPYDAWVEFGFEDVFVGGRGRL